MSEPEKPKAAKPAKKKTKKRPVPGPANGASDARPKAAPTGVSGVSGGAEPPKKADVGRLMKVLRGLEGKPVLYYLTSPVGGPALDLHFGLKVPRRQPLDVAGLTAVQRHHEGELSLYVTCAWRVESRESVLCGCWDDNEPDGQMRHGLNQLVGQRVRRAMAQAPAWDLALELENGRLLRVFCDQTHDEEGADNYALFTADEVFTIGAMSDVFIEPRGPDDD